MLNLPCYDARTTLASGPALINAMLRRGYDVHFGSVGNSYLSPIMPFFYGTDNPLASADVVHAAPKGDFLLRANDRSRLAFEGWAKVEENTLEDQDHSIFDMRNWPELNLPKASYSVEYYCDKTNEYTSFTATTAETGPSATPVSSQDVVATATESASESHASSEVHEPKTAKTGPLLGSTSSLCEAFRTQFYLAVGCSQEPACMVRSARGTIDALVKADAFHLNRCKDVEYCDIQQLVPLKWV